MKMVQSVLLGIFAFLPSGMASVILCPATSTCLQAADKKVRTSVTGTGKTKSDAENDAARSARQISTSYTTISKKTSGADKNYICIMVIEYAQK